MAEKKPSLQSPDVNPDIERYRASFERSIDSPREKIAETSLPWVVRMSTRDLLFDGFIDPPVGLGDNWGLQLTYNMMTERSQKLKEISQPDPVQIALGFAQEPWMKPSIIPEQNMQKLTEALLIKNKGDKEATKSELSILVEDAEKRVPLLSKELIRSRDELTTVRRLIYMWWNWRNAASGQELGQDYLDSKIAVTPRFDDFQKVFALPATFMTKNEVGETPGYPEPDQVQAAVEFKNLTKEQEGFGELVQRESRLITLVALADQPEEIMKWKLQAETKKLHDILAAKGINEAYLFLKRKGFEYNDPIEEQKIAGIIRLLTDAEKKSIENAFWNQFGYKDETESRQMIGYPEMWIPIKARRGDPSVDDSSPFLELDGTDKTVVNRNERIEKIKKEMVGLRDDWRKLSPLNNPSSDSCKAIYADIQKRTDNIRNISTSMYLKDDDSKEYEPVTILPSLQLENELNLRGNATREGCFWARPQMSKDKEDVIENGLISFVGNNRLAYEEALAITGLMGIPSKWGYYARDYNPSVREKAVQQGKVEPGAPGYLPKEWQVDVEAWPYTSEYQNVLAFPWHQQYKAEAAGPDGSRGRFGPLMTDYLTAYPVDKYDANNNKLYVVMDKNGILKYGRPDEGVIITDTAVTIMDYWREGGSLANPEPWGKIIEDPYRRFKLRGFFASGKTVIGGGDLLSQWKKRDWKLEDLDTDKFWDDYKLARRVALREELFNEDVWREVTAPVNAEYKRQAAECAAKVKSARTEEARIAEMKKGRRLYRQWRVNRKKAVFDYSDKTFGEGLSSTQMIENAILSRAMQRVGSQMNLENPKSVVNRISRRAENHDIHLGWDVDKMFNFLKNLKEFGKKYD